jgi:hypothetical protein
MSDRENEPRRNAALVDGTDQDDLGRRIFASDSGRPLTSVPDVVVVPVRRACVDEAVGPDYDVARAPVQKYELSPLDYLELRYKPGRCGSGTREWLPLAHALQATGSHKSVSRNSPFSDPDEPPACDTVYHGAPTADDPLPALEVETVSAFGYMPTVVSAGWGSGWNAPVVDYPGPVGTVKRSMGVVTNVAMADIEIRSRCSWTDTAVGPRKSKSKY